jgi:hypothetical protein
MKSLGVRIFEGLLSFLFNTRGNRLSQFLFPWKLIRLKFRSCPGLLIRGYMPTIRKRKLIEDIGP